MGGTGSIMGVLRVEPQVLEAGEVDLLVVEFAVNDGGQTEEQTKLSMEGLVRKTWSLRPHCDILFVYTLTNWGLVIAKNDYLPLQHKYPVWSFPLHEEVASYYSIPSVHMGLEISRLTHLGKVLWKNEWSSNATLANDTSLIRFSRDCLHPTTSEEAGGVRSGKEYYAKSLFRSLPLILQARSNESNGRNHDNLRPSLSERNYQNAHAFTVGSTSNHHFAPSVHPLSEEERIFLGLGESCFLGAQAMLAQHPGDRITVRFNGSALGVVAAVGHFSGDLALNSSTDKIVASDKYQIFSSFNFQTRLGFYILAHSLPRDREHEVTLDVHHHLPEKTKLLAPHRVPVLPQYHNLTYFLPCAFTVIP